MVKGNPFETLKSKKTKTGRFTIVQDQVRVNGYEQPYDYLEIGNLSQVRNLLVIKEIYIAQILVPENA